MVLVILMTLIVLATAGAMLTTRALESTTSRSGGDFGVRSMARPQDELRALVVASQRDRTRR